MAFSRRHNSSSPVDDVPTVVVDKPIPDRPIPDVWAEYAKRRRERVQNAEQKFSEMIGTRPYDPDDKDAFDGQIDAEAADWTTEDVATHRKWCSEISERLAEAENEVTRTETKLAAAEQELREAEQKMLDAPPLQSGGRPTPAPTTDAADVAEPAATQAGAQSMGRWRDPVAMHRMHNPWWIPWLLLGAFGGDIAVFYVVLERLLRSSLVTVIIVALAFALLALGLSRVIGRSLRRRKAHDPDRNDIWLWVPLGAWILLGLAAASGRLFFGNLSAPVLVFGAPEASSARGDDLAVLPAVIFFVLYLGSGIVAMTAFFARSTTLTLCAVSLLTNPSVCAATDAGSKPISTL